MDTVAHRDTVDTQASAVILANRDLVDQAFRDIADILAIQDQAFRDIVDIVGIQGFQVILEYLVTLDLVYRDIAVIQVLLEQLEHRVILDTVDLVFLDLADILDILELVAVAVHQEVLQHKFSITMRVLLQVLQT